jgi:hypothetical protein
MKLTTNIDKQETPTIEIIQQSKKEYTVKDSLGRTIVVQRPSWLKQCNFMKALGDRNVNDAYMQAISTLMFVKSLNGIPITLNNDLEIDKWLNELDFEGKVAVEKCLVESFKMPSQEEAKDEIKK